MKTEQEIVNRIGEISRLIESIRRSRKDNEREWEPHLKARFTKEIKVLEAEKRVLYWVLGREKV